MSYLVEYRVHFLFQTPHLNQFPQFVYHRLDYIENITLDAGDVCIRDEMMIMPNNATIKVYLFRQTNELMDSL